MTAGSRAKPTTADLDGRTALVTGAGSGMGAATAMLFARHGARVVVADRDKDAGTVASILAAGGQARFVPTDVSVNLRAVALCLKHELRQLVAQGGPASIVNVGSVSSVRARPGNAAYVAAKHAVIGLTKVAALEHGHQEIRVNAVLPGGIDTPMLRESRAARGDAPTNEFALSLFGRLGTPDEVAEANLWLCSDRSSYVSGHSLAVDSGYLAR